MKEKKNKKQKPSIIQQIERLLLKTAVILSRISVFFSSWQKLHNARFARIDEIDKRLMPLVPV